MDRRSTHTRRCTGNDSREPCLYRGHNRRHHRPLSVRLLDLFSGIGGFSLAAQWVWGDELEIVGFCEIEKYAQKVLQKNFPGVPIYEDITKLNGKDFKNIDLITGGFPCQDISVAGKGAGIEGARSSLWFEMHRIIREVRPRYALIENVPMLTVRGGTRVIADLTEIGYDSEWTIIGADDVGAWHRRKRIWIVAYDTQRHSLNSDTNRIRSHKKRININRETQFCDKQDSIFGSVGGKIPRPGNDRQIETANVPDTNRTRRRERWRFKPIQEKFDTSERNSKRTFSTYWSVEPNVGLLADGLSTGLGGYWDREPDIPRVATGIKDRVSKLKGLGNAIVPQVAALIMEKIKDAEI